MRKLTGLKIVAYYITYIGTLLVVVGGMYFIGWKMLKFVIDYIVSVM